MLDAAVGRYGVVSAGAAVNAVASTIAVSCWQGVCGLIDPLDQAAWE
jgi:hypothetical protein